MLPWDAWMAHAQHAFGISPVVFWGLSLREWRALIGAGAAPMKRNEFAALAARFPD